MSAPRRISPSQLQAMLPRTLELDIDLFDEHEHLAVLPAATLRAMPFEVLQLWAMLHGVYQFPTVELVDWLREEIGQHTAIEIGAGHGSIARALGIPATDSYIQTTPEMRLLYAIQYGQAVTEPPPDVLRFEATEAVRHFKPHTVIGAWVTQLFQPGDTEASVYGANEELIVRHCQRYIFVGNASVHGNKRILAVPHRVFKPNWLVSRSGRQDLNQIWIWGDS